MSDRNFSAPGHGKSDPQTVKAVTDLLGAGAAVGVVLPFSRTQESEADHLNVIYMAKAGFDPHAALTSWQRMMEAQKGKAPPEVMSDHPADEKRIQQIQEWMPEAMTYYKAKR